MKNIDFSKAPEGATHYDDSTAMHGWWRKTNIFGWSIYIGRVSGVDTWSSVKLHDYSMLKEIPKENKMIIECKTEREQMLCEQVLRVIRGEASQQLVNTYWKDVPPDNIINIDKLIRYRAKPKKELVVPWDILSDEVTEIKIDKHGNIYDGGTPLRIKLDLTEIELPITVKRPTEK